MNPDWSDYPISIFTAAANHVVGRLLFFFGTLAMAVLLGSSLAAWTGDHIGPLTVFKMYSIMVISELFQVWGIVIYGTMAVFLAIYYHKELSFKWLLIPFVLQAFETYR